ncbi:MAG: AmmeMemoRadiSam system radical SAM enzyme [Methanomassiliicoccales archaeon]|nr:AmmeMemoRadiSam system radical SAM enzyme [Methanomassiliicoccales archaeon]
MKEARFWRTEDGRAVCGLCPHSCRIASGKRGICGVRENRDGRLFSLIYGKASSIHVDPIEKKPFFHFKPGEKVLSLGSVGCTFRCQHCQNYTISQAAVGEFGLEDLSPEEVLTTCRRFGCTGISWTYNEPTIWHEFSYETSKLAKSNGLHTDYVTNGYIQEAPLRELAECIDAMNIDIKAFREDFYKKVCKASLNPVLEATMLAHELGIHVELTYLIIPGKNDTEAEIRDFSRWVVQNLDPKVPVHFTRFHPDYLMDDVPTTPMKTLDMAYAIGKAEGMKHPYTGNVPGDERENTYCPKCGALMIRRMGFNVIEMRTKDGKCPTCGEQLNILM